MLEQRLLLWLPLAGKTNEKEVIENSNMLFVVAAGNDGENLNEDFPSYPSAFALNNILSVTAIDDAGVLLLESNYGDKHVDVAMYGSNIDVRFADGGHEMVSGTSIAVPYVSASAALIYAYALNELSSTEIKDIIVQSSEKTKGNSTVKYKIEEEEIYMFSTLAVSVTQRLNTK